MNRARQQIFHWLGMLALLGVVIAPGQVAATDAETYFGKGVEYFGQGDMRKAEAYFRHATQIDANHRHAYLALADVYVAQRRFPLAAKVMDDGLKRFGTDARFWLMKGLVQREQGDGPGAKTAYMKALELAPKDIDVLNTVQNHLYYVGDVTEALALRERRKQIEAAR